MDLELLVVTPPTELLLDVPIPVAGFGRICCGALFFIITWGCSGGGAWGCVACWMIVVGAWNVACRDVWMNCCVPALVWMSWYIGWPVAVVCEVRIGNWGGESLV